MTAASERQSSETALCECGHPISEHAESGWGPNTVCVQKLDDENAGWYGVCPCVRHICGRLLVGQGDDTYDPLCVLPEGHDGICKPEEVADAA